MASAIAPVTCTDVGSIQIRYGGRRLKLETVKKKNDKKIYFVVVRRLHSTTVQHIGHKRRKTRKNI